MALREVLAQFNIELNDDQLKEGDKLVNGFIGTLKNMGGVIAGAFAIGAIKDFFGQLIEQADALNDSATALGITTDQLQEFQYAADLGGSKAEAVTAALNRLQRTAADPKALKGLGVNLKEFEGLNTVDRFERIADGIADIKDPAKQAELASKFFGKSVSTLMPLLKQGGDGIRELREEFHAMGGGFDEDFVKTAADAKDEMDRIDLIMKSMKISLAGALLPSIRSALMWFRELAADVIPVVRQFAAWAGSTKILQVAFTGLALRGVAFLSGKIGPLGALLRRLAVWAMRTLLPFLLLEDAFVFLAGGDSLLGEVIDKIFGKGTGDKVRGWIDTVKNSVFGLIDDLSNRPLKLLDDWHVFTETLSADIENLFGPFFGGVLNSLGSFWIYILDMMTGGWDNFVGKLYAGLDGIVLIATIAWTEIKFGFLTAAAAISDAFDGVWNSVKAGAATVLDVINKIPGVDVSAAAQGLRVETGGQEGAKVSAMRDKARLGLAGQYDNIAARASTSAAPPQLTSNVTVNVAGSADASTAAKVGAAAASGSQKGMGKARAAQSAVALKPAG